MRDTDDLNDIEKVLKKIGFAYDFGEDARDKYRENIRLVYINSLTDDDETILSSEGRSRMKFPIIAPIISNQLKNVRDAIPTPEVVPFNDDDPEVKKISNALTEEINGILESSSYEDVLCEASENACTGGMGVFKIRTDYINDTDFSQRPHVEAVIDPTSVFFDPAAKSKTKSDAGFAFEFSYVHEDDFKEQYPDFEMDKLTASDSQTKIQWVNRIGPKNRKVFTLAEYFYKEHKKKTLYWIKREPFLGPVPEIAEVEADQEAEDNFDLFVSEQKPADKDLIFKEREVDEVTVCRMLICGKAVIEKKSILNFKEIPYVFLCSDRKVIDGREVLIPLAQSAIDAQRAKNIVFNHLFFEITTNQTGTWSAPEEGATDQMMDAVTNPTQKKILLHKSYDDQSRPIAPPVYHPPAQLPSDNIAIFKEMDNTINTILGAQYPSMDQTNMTSMSGKALYNLADFMSASIAPLMQNLIVAVGQIAKIILSSLPFLYSQKSVTMNKGKMTESSVNLDFKDLDMGQFNIIVKKGSSYALQQQQTVEQLIGFAKVSQGFAKWLETSGMPLLLENSPLNKKQEIINSYEMFTKQSQMQAQQQPKQPDPQMISAQAQLIVAQAEEKKLQLSAQEMALKAQKMQIDNQNEKANQTIELLKIKKDRKNSIDRDKINIYKTIHDNKHKEKSLKHNTALSLLKNLGGNDL